MPDRPGRAAERKALSRMNPETESSSRPLRVAVVSSVFPPEFTYSVANQRQRRGSSWLPTAGGHRLRVVSEQAGRAGCFRVCAGHCMRNEGAGIQADPLLSFLAPESRILSRLRKTFLSA